jgi:hypothetical protein
MSVKLLAASALLVQCGALLVIYKLFALSNVKPTQVCSAPACSQVILIQQHWQYLKGNYDLNSDCEKADRLQEQKRTGIPLY